jgi:two-component system sensor histidine kinase DesK
MNPLRRVHRFLLPDNRNVGWIPYLWLVYLTGFVFWVASGGTDTRLRVSGAVAIALFLVLYFRGYRERGVRLVAIIVAITVLGALFVPLHPSAIVFYIFAGAFAGMVGRPRAGAIVLACIAAFVVAHGLVLALNPVNVAVATVVTLLIGIVNIYYVENSRQNEALRLSEQEIRRLAVVAERERIARDLHDLLGHTLSVIALKSELAAKLIGRDDARAAAEVREIESITRGALAEVRAAVTGFRAGLAQELANARRALEAADIEFSYELGVDDLPARHEDVLAMVLREGVTNIVRHSGASSCRLTIVALGGMVRLELRDDGRGGVVLENSGLTGIRARLATIGGALEIVQEGGVALRVTAPLGGGSV